MTPAATRDVSRRAWLAVAAASVVSVAVTSVVVLLDVRARPEGQLGLDTAAAMIGVLLAYLLFGRFRESRRLRDLMLCGFLLLLGASNAAFSAVPRSFGGVAMQGASGLSGLAAGAMFAGATVAPPWTWRHRPRLAGLVLLLWTSVLLALSARLAPLLPGRGMGSADTFGATPDRTLTVAQIVAAALFALAALGSARSATADRLLLWLTGAAVLAAASRIDFAIASAVGDVWSTAGTLLRVAFYVTLVAAAGAEIGSYWRRVAQVAVLEERRRMARDLHDGVSQELAFTATQAHALADVSEHPARARLVAAAAERALDESRRAIAALTRPLDEPLDVTLSQCAEEVCGRFEKALVLDVQSGVQAPPETREALVRILREAVSNAARHSSANEVRVHLRQAGGLALRVEDDGTGFDVSDVGQLPGRFGLISMRERAEALGGTFAVVSRLQGGTAIEVMLP